MSNCKSSHYFKSILRLLGHCFNEIFLTGWAFYTGDKVSGCNSNIDSEINA